MSDQSPLHDLGQTLADAFLAVQAERVCQFEEWFDALPSTQDLFPSQEHAGKTEKAPEGDDFEQTDTED